MNNNILNNKFFVVFLLFLIITFSFVSNCFANIVVNDNSSFPDLPLDYSNSKYVILKDNTNTWLLIFDDLLENPYVENDNISFKNKSGSLGNVIGYLLKNNTWNYNFKTTAVSRVSTFTFICSNIDVMKGSNSNEIFFQKTPVTAVEIPALETAEQIPEAMATALKIIIPVGLAILVIGLIIYLIKCVIYRIR